MSAKLQRKGLSVEVGQMESSIAKMEVSVQHQQSKLDDCLKQTEGAEHLLKETGGTSESMVAQITEELKVNVEEIERLAPIVEPLQEEVSKMKTASESLAAEIEVLREKARKSSTERQTLDDTIASTMSDIKILKDRIEETKLESEPLAGAIEDTIEETERLVGLVNEYKEKHGGMRSADFTSIKSTGSKSGFKSKNQGLKKSPVK